MNNVVEPPSGTRDFLASDVRKRERAFGAARAVFERYGFDPLQTPAFERIEVLTEKYGDEGDKLIFKILKRGEHEGTGEADMALRYDLTVPLARVVAKYGNALPVPYKRYAIGPVWRADRPGKGRFREFTQCDIDTVGSLSPMADAEIMWAVHDALSALGVENFQFQLNSRKALFGLLDAYQVPSHLAMPVLITLDKMDKVGAEEVARQLRSRGLGSGIASALAEDLSVGDSDLLRQRLESTEDGRDGLAEVDRLLRLTQALRPDRVRFNVSLVRGLDYYTGAIWEVAAPGFPGSIASGGRYDRLVASLGGPDMPACGGSIGIERIMSSLDTPDDEATNGLDVAITTLDEGADVLLTELAGNLRRVGLRVGTYLGSSRKLARQLRWANDNSADVAVLCGQQDMAEGVVTVRAMGSGDQHRVPAAEAHGVITKLIHAG